MARLRQAFRAGFRIRAGVAAKTERIDHRSPNFAEKISTVAGSFAAINSLPGRDRTMDALLFSRQARNAHRAGPSFRSALLLPERLFRWRGWNLRYATAALIAACRAVPDRKPPRPDRSHCGCQPACCRRVSRFARLSDGVSRSLGAAQTCDTGNYVSFDIRQNRPHPMKLHGSGRALPTL